MLLTQPICPTSSAKFQPMINILILDDCEFDRKRLQRMIARLDYLVNVDVAANADKFCDALDDKAYDLVFVDYYVPSFSGLDAIKTTKDSLLNAQVPTVMISGEITPKIARQSFYLGCLRHISKSNLDTTSLCSVIEKASRNKSKPAVKAMGRTVVDAYGRFGNGHRPKLHQ